MNRSTLAAVLQARFRELTLGLFAASIVAAIVGLTKSLSLGAGALALGWGIAAGAFGLSFGIRAVVSFVYHDGDYVEIWSTLAAFMYTLWAFAAFTWFGIAAAVLVTTAWIVGRAGHRREEQLRRRIVRQRREALQSRRRTDSGPVASAPLLEESHLDLTERSRRRAAEDAASQHPVTRRGTVERGRIIDGNPWHLPPDDG